MRSASTSDYYLVESPARYQSFVRASTGGGTSQMSYYCEDSRKRHIESMAEYIVTERCTIRDVAKIFGVSKSKVHSDFSTRLQGINSRLYDETRSVLDYNKEVCTQRGGESTRLKYLSLRTDLK